MAIYTKGKLVVEAGAETYYFLISSKLEDLDFLIDCGNQRLYPRDPEHIIAEAEVLA